MSVTNPLKNSADYKDGVWSKKLLTDDFVDDVLEKTKESYSTLFFYATGIFVTAYARRNVYMTMLSSHEFDRHVIYTDTDSIKYYGNYDAVFEAYNKEVYKKYQKVCKNFGQLKIDDFIPKDIKGNCHPLGYWDFDGEYTSFITLGAKKYCYTDDKGLHITVSGVSKKGASALSSIDDFKPSFTWGYRDSHKLAHYYNDNQPKVVITDAEGHKWKNKYKHGLVLQPTTYTLGMTDIYLALIEYYQEKEDRNE